MAKNHTKPRSIILYYLQGMPYVGHRETWRNVRVKFFTILCRMQLFCFCFVLSKQICCETCSIELR